MKAKREDKYQQQLLSNNEHRTEYHVTEKGKLTF